MQIHQKETDYIPALDGLRCISILMVLFGHYIETTGYSLPTIFRPCFDGTLGVNIFFVISGFLITRIVLASEQSQLGFSFQSFYLKRVAKLVPVLWLFIAVVSTATWYLNETISAFDTFRAAAFLTMNAKMIESAVLSHTWSLSVEEFFYLSWVPLLYYRQRLSKSAFMFLVGIALISAPLVRILNTAMASNTWGQYFNWYPLPVVPIVGSLDFLVAGACVHLFKKEISTLLSPLLRNTSLPLVLSAILFIVLPSIGTVIFGIVSSVNVVVGGSLQALGICLIVHVLANERKIDPWRLLESKSMVTIGLSSYSIYVFQQICFYPLPGMTLHKNFLIFASIPVALIGGIVIFFLVERPINTYLRSKWLPKPNRNTSPGTKIDKAS
jgi:peptidoglycan/LPS O-acetylase OafA/YrhL